MHLRSRYIRPITGYALAAAAVLLLGACSSQSSESTEASTPDTAGGATSTTVGPVFTNRDSGEHSVTVAFWQQSTIDTSTGAPPVPDRSEQPPRIESTFYWDDPSDCYIWERTVAASQGGGTRLNAATDFSIEEVDGVWIFTYAQNAKRCDPEEFTREGGTVKTLRSDVLTIDETTGQTGDPSWGAVVDVEGT